jgi:hypothetical protein
LMHVSRKQIPMLMTFDMYITYYCYNIMFYPIKLYNNSIFNYVQMFHHLTTKMKVKGKHKKGEGSSSSS